jgi:hypothetical protein
MHVRCFSFPFLKSSFKVVAVVPNTFSCISPRVAWLRGIVLCATFLGLLASTPLWLASRPFPSLSVAPWFPIVPAPFDKWFFGVVLFSLVLACWHYRPFVIFFLCASLFLYGGDQNRGQPWLYMYWVMLLLTLLPEPAALAGCRFALSVVYLWGGIHKCNAKFLSIVPAWFVRPASEWGWPAWAVTAMQWLVALAPAVEILIGLALWFPRLRWPAVGAAAMLHLGAILFLGPLGHKHNLVVWPWNLAMVALVAALASKGQIREAFAELRKSRLAIAVLALFALLPLLNLFGRWDSYFSFALYSGDIATADIYLNSDFHDRLPPEMQRHVHQVTQDFNPVVQGPYVFDHQAWGMETLGSPAIPEPRSFQATFRYISSYATNVGDLRMIVAPKSAPPVLYQGTNRWTLVIPKP